jgi:hypothetical protein
MKSGMVRRGRSDFAVFASAVAMSLISGACGRTPLLDGLQNPPVDAQIGHDVGAQDSRGTFLGDTGDGKPDGGPDVGLTIGNNTIAVASCSPNDATAVSITIGVDQPSCGSTSSGSYIAVAIWYTNWDNLKPGTYPLDARGGIAMSVYSPVQGGSNWEVGTNTVLTIESIDSDRMIGHCESSFPSGTVSMDFTARWCGGNPMCG